MRFDNSIVREANRLRESIQRNPKFPTVDHGESVAILVWYTFLRDHSAYEGIPVEELARMQLEAFLAHAREHIAMMRPGEH
jgi:hypothetical protein